MQDCNRLAEDIFNYLSAKLPNMDKATEMEVSEYIGNRVYRYLLGAISERDREWKQALKSQQRHFNKEIDRQHKNRRGE